MCSSGGPFMLTCDMGSCTGGMFRCGGLDEPCCAGSTCTGSGLVCESGFGGGGTCEACGGDGEPCCPGETCNDGGCCVVGDDCVADGDACTDATGDCASGSCEGGTCGSIGQPCCEDGFFDFCSAPFARCTGAGICAACGGDGQLCCEGGYCGAPFVCSPTGGGARCTSPMP
jgi:hypothetical protein